MKPEHFLYKSDGLYYMQNVPKEPEYPIEYGAQSTAHGDDVRREWEAYFEAIEFAKAEAVKVDDPKLVSAVWALIDPFNNPRYEVGEIYRVNMEEKIEVIEEPEFPGFDHTSYPTFKKVARIAEPKESPRHSNPFHECSMDLMTDVSVYSCECGKIQIANNLSCNDSPIEYIPLETTPKKSEESEHQWDIWREAIEIPEKMRGMEDYEVIQELEKYFEIKRKQL